MQFERAVGKIVTWARTIQLHDIFIVFALKSKRADFDIRAVALGMSFTPYNRNDLHCLV